MALKLKYDGKQFLAAGIVLMAVGIFSAIFGIVQRTNFEDMKQWPVVRADVTKVVEHYKEGSMARPGNMFDIDYYTFTVEFTVGDNTYSKVYSSEIFSRLIHPEEKYDMKYNPKDHGEAYIDSRMPKSVDYYWYGVLCGAIGIPVFFFAFDKKKTQKIR